MIPISYVDANNFRLGEWIMNIRIKDNGTYRKGGYELTEEQKAALTSLGMKWGDRFSIGWDIAFAELEDFYKYNGHITVPVNFRTKSGRNLNNWIAWQRKIQDRLSVEQKEKLKSLGIRLEPLTFEHFFEKYFAMAEQYVEEFGTLEDISPLYKTKDNVWLGKWVYEMRTKYHENNPDDCLTKDMITRLEGLGISWLSAAKRAWERGYNELRKFYLKEGHTNLPHQYKTEEGFDLYNWFLKQKKDKRNTELPLEREALLEKLNVRWGRKPTKGTPTLNSINSSDIGMTHQNTEAVRDKEEHPDKSGESKSRKRIYVLSNSRQTALKKEHAID